MDSFFSLLFSSRCCFTLELLTFNSVGSCARLLAIVATISVQNRRRMLRQTKTRPSPLCSTMFQFVPPPLFFLDLHTYFSAIGPSSQSVFCPQNPCFSVFLNLDHAQNIGKSNVKNVIHLDGEHLLALLFLCRTPPITVFQPSSVVMQ